MLPGMTIGLERRAPASQWAPWRESMRLVDPPLSDHQCLIHRKLDISHPGSAGW